MKIYTQQGDQGITSLADGTRVKKNDPRIDAIGTIDELNSWIGLLIDESEIESAKTQLTEVQKYLFQINAHLAQYYLSEDKKLSAQLTDEILIVEQQIDEMQKHLPPLTHFILYGGNIVVSHIHISRAVCRKVERKLMSLENILPPILGYFNRLSDYLFVMARYTTMILRVEEKYWIPKI